ncbi:hypothetical protein HDE_03430 [Halotydeus destructor]|nr:hypothetical protein HDE_03430 [Halotydeus destructor]
MLFSSELLIVVSSLLSITKSTSADFFKLSNFDHLLSENHFNMEDVSSILKKIDDKVDLKELEEGLKKIKETGNTEGLQYFVEMIKSQEMKLEKQYEFARQKSEELAVGHPEVAEKALHDEEEKVHQAMDKLHEVEHEAEEVLDEMIHPEHHYHQLHRHQDVKEAETVRR